VLTDLGALDDFEDGRIQVRRVGGREYGVLRWGARLVAIRNKCPHAGAPLCRGVVAPRVDGAVSGPVADVAADEQRLVISCPWHGWEFDVDTGGALADPSVRVRTYPLSVRDGRVVLDTAA